MLLKNEIMEALFVVVLIGGLAILAYHEFKLCYKMRKAQQMLNEDSH